MPTAKIIFSQDYHLLQILLDILNKFSRIKKYPKLVKKKKNYVKFCKRFSSVGKN